MGKVTCNCLSGPFKQRVFCLKNMNIEVLSEEGGTVEEVLTVEQASTC